MNEAFFKNCAQVEDMGPIFDEEAGGGETPGRREAGGHFFCLEFVWGSSGIFSF
jgi:hypothetical protein